MSSSFDVLQRIFMDRFEPMSGDDFEKQLFFGVITSMHSANHQLNDGINKSAGVSNAIRMLEEYIQEKAEHEPRRN